MRLIGLAVVLTLRLTLAPLAAEAQPTPARLAMLLTGPPATATPEYAAFMKQLGDLGWIEGQTLAVDRRWADAPEKFIGLAADAVRAKPTVILAAGPDATRAAQQATSAVPIVMIVGHRSSVSMRRGEVEPTALLKARPIADDVLGAHRPPHRLGRDNRPSCLKLRQVFEVVVDKVSGVGLDRQRAPRRRGPDALPVGLAEALQ
jgi:hypothetical protein